MLYTPYMIYKVLLIFFYILTYIFMLIFFACFVWYALALFEDLDGGCKKALIVEYFVIINPFYHKSSF